MPDSPPATQNQHDTIEDLRAARDTAAREEVIGANDAITQCAA